MKTNALTTELQKKPTGEQRRVNFEPQRTHSGTAPQDECLLARRQLSVGRPDLSLRQSAAEGAAETVAREAAGGRTLGHDAGPELHLRASEPGHQEV